MTGSTEHGLWREQVAGAIIERHPPDPALATHLAGCAECTDTWRQLSGASARLIAAARTFPLEAEPPTRLRDRGGSKRTEYAPRRDDPAAAHRCLETRNPPGAT